MEPSLLNILAIGRNVEIMQVMQRLINVPGKWTGKTVTTDEEAFAASTEEPFDITLLCSGISETAEEALRKKLAAINPAMIVIRHYGGGSGLLENEIRAALQQASA
jgi:hypothetical protein